MCILYTPRPQLDFPLREPGFLALPGLQKDVRRLQGCIHGGAVPWSRQEATSPWDAGVEELRVRSLESTTMQVHPMKPQSLRDVKNKARLLLERLRVFG